MRVYLTPLDLIKMSAEELSLVQHYCTKHDNFRDKGQGIENFSITNYGDYVRVEWSENYGDPSLSLISVNDLIRNIQNNTNSNFSHSLFLEV